MNKKISIIIPVYNSEKYVRKTIESCFGQTYNNIEVIAVDDGSSDDSFKILEDCKKNNFPELIIEKNKKNLGLIKTLNNTIDKCSGEYVLILGNDDILEKTHLEYMIKAFEENDKLSFVYCNSNYIDSNDKVFGFSNTEDLNKCFRKIAYSNVINSCGLIMNKEKLLSVGKYPYFEEYNNYGEWYLWISLLKIGDCKFMKDIRTNYRIHATNLTKSLTKTSNLQKTYNYYIRCMYHALNTFKFSTKDKVIIYCRIAFFKLKTKCKIFLDKRKKDE